jgi:hypothetical protein
LTPSPLTETLATVSSGKPSFEGPSRGLRLAVFLGAFAAVVGTIPRLVCGTGAGPLFDGERESQAALADGVVEAMDRHHGHVLYASGGSRFDGQSAIAAYQMTIMGLSQIVQGHPDLRERYLPALREAGRKIADPKTLAYAAHVYGHNGIVAMNPGEGHAYLGYVNLALGMLRAVDPGTPLAALHDRLSAQLAARLFASPNGLIETYPGETWPPDVAAVAGSVGLHAKVTGADLSTKLGAWAALFAKCAIAEGGYLVQRVQSGTCKPVDAPRGSGTAVAAYFLHFADRSLSSRLHRALVENGERSLLGFGAIREYLGESGAGDGNSGPVVLGVSIGATGFGLGAAASHGDRELFVRLYRTAYLFGVPRSDGERRTFVMGGALGNALLLAMLTARPS